MKYNLLLQEELQFKQRIQLLEDEVTTISNLNQTYKNEMNGYQLKLMNTRYKSK